MALLPEEKVAQIRQTTDDEYDGIGCKKLNLIIKLDKLKELIADINSETKTLAFVRMSHKLKNIKNKLTLLRWNVMQFGEESTSESECECLEEQ